MNALAGAAFALLVASSAAAQQPGPGSTPAAPPSKPRPATTLEEALKELFDQALRINIVARVMPAGEQPIVNVERSQLTLPGHSVAVRFEGSNIRVTANLTPYLQNDGKLTLVAQGEVWVAEPTSTDKAVRYLSSIKSLPVSLGEKVFFYPLGIPDAIQGTNKFNIALEIQIVPVDEAPPRAQQAPSR
jgi:hypothetical protein